MTIRLQINLKRAIHNSKVIYWRLLAGTAIMLGQKNYLPLSPGERSPFSKENVRQMLQTLNPARPDFNMRQHIARCTLRPSLEV